MRLRVPSGSTNAPFGPLCRRGTAPFLLAVVLAVGCGDGKGDKNEISGKVTLNGQPVAGEVVFVYADNKEIPSPLMEGKYLIVNAPTGAVKVYIRPPLAVTGGLIAPPKTGAEIPKDAPGSAPTGVPAPAKYQAVGTSGLTYEVKTGKQTYDIPLQ